MKDKDLHTKAREIAAVLGWRCEYRTEEQEGPYDRLWANEPKGAGVVLHSNSYSKPGRIEITGIWPKAIPDSNWYFHPHNDRPVITVAFDRSAEVIAKEIKRRLLPKYLPLFQEQAQLRQSILDDIIHRQQFGMWLASETGWEYRPHRNDVHFHIGETWGEFEINGISGREFDISLKGVSVRLTLRIAQLVREALS